MTRGFNPALLLMPLSYACIFGGLVTIIGTSTNLVVQGLVMEWGEEGLGFFEPGYIGLPLGVVGMLYLSVAAPRILAGAGGGGGGGGGRSGEREEALLTEVTRDEGRIGAGHPQSREDGVSRRLPIVVAFFSCLVELPVTWKLCGTFLWPVLYSVQESCIALLLGDTDERARGGYV